MKKILYFAIAILLFVVSSLFLKTNLSQNHQNSDYRTTSDLKVSATIFPLYDIVGQIVGNEIDVVLILPPGASPHTFEATPSMLRELQNVDVVYSIGYELDEWASDIVSSQGADVQTVSNGINVRSGEKHEDEDDHVHEEDRHAEQEDEDEDDHAHEHGEFDPHYWLSTSNARQIARNVTKDLLERYPSKETLFQTNLTAYLHKLDQTEVEINDLFLTLDNKNIVTFHDAWNYFSDEFGLTIVGTFEPSAGRAPTPKYLADLTNALEKANTSTIFSEFQFGAANLKAFADDNNLNIVELDPLGGIESRTSYTDLMLYNARVITDNN